MLAVAGFAMVLVLLIAMVARWLSPVSALVLIPFVTALLLGFSLTEVGEFALEGLSGIVPIVALFVFAIIFFGVMTDAGLFEPIVRRLVSFAGENPVTIALATVALALVTHLDGAGATTVLITVPALLPVYKYIGMRKVVLAGLVGLSIGVMNIVPWGGPTARAGAALEMDPNALWVPLIPVQIVGAIVVFGIAYYWGKKEQRRIGLVRASAPQNSESESPSAAPESGLTSDPSLRRPGRYWLNAVLTVLVLAVLISGVLDSALVFMIGLIFAFFINYPGAGMQTARIEAHSQGAIMMATILLAAGVFVGIVTETGMIEAMAVSLASLVPPSLAGGLPLIVGVLGVPLGVFFSPDAYYFGVLPVLAGVGSEFGIEPKSIGQASILAEDTMQASWSPFNGSAWMLLGLSEVSFAEHFRFSLVWAWGVSIIMLLAAFAFGIIPFWS